MVYICAKFHENILNDNRVMEQTRKVNGQTRGRRARHITTRLRRAYKMALKINTNELDHMTKMAAKLIYCKNLKFFFSRIN